MSMRGGRGGEFGGGGGMRMQRTASDAAARDCCYCCCYCCCCRCCCLPPCRLAAASASASSLRVPYLATPFGLSARMRRVAVAAAARKRTTRGNSGAGTRQRGEPDARKHDATRVSRGEAGTGPARQHEDALALNGCIVFFKARRTRPAKGHSQRQRRNHRQSGCS